jgi:hypothetical protein
LLAAVALAAGPRTWDCSSFTQSRLCPNRRQDARTATAQRNWLATGKGTRINPAEKIRRPDLLGLLPRTQPDRARHDHLDPVTKTTIEARNTRAGVGHFSYANCLNHHILEIWRVGTSPRIDDVRLATTVGLAISLTARVAGERLDAVRHSRTVSAGGPDDELQRWLEDHGLAIDADLYGSAGTHSN